MEKMQTKPYASLVGSLIYTTICTRNDIACIVGMSGRFQENLREAHLVATKKVLRYSKRAKNDILVYGREDPVEIVGPTILICAISWKSEKLTIIATSMMEAEFVACFE